MDERVKKSVKEKVVDTFSNVSYSLAVGAALDYAAGLDTEGMIASRTSATLMNIFTGAPYGMWKDYVFKKTNTGENNSRLRKTLVDLLAFNTFQLPIYAIAVSVGSLVSEGRVAPEKISDGVRNLAFISPLIGPTFGFYYDLMRQTFGLRTSAQKVEEKNND